MASSSIRILNRPIVNILNDHLIDYPTPININYLWNFGSLAGIFLGIQIVSGIFLAMHYTPHVDLAFLSVEHIMRDVNNGWLVRYLHANGASMFFLVVYIHEELSRGVVEEVGLAGFDEAEVVGDRGSMREHIAHPRAALAVLLELLIVAEQVDSVARAHEREALAFDEAGGDGLAVEFVELGLVVEELELTRAAGHEEVDDALGLRSVMRLLRGVRIGGWRGLVLGEQRRQGDRTEADAAVAEEVAAGAAEEAEGVSHG